MPNCNTFLSTFHLIKGINFGRYYVNDVSCIKNNSSRNLMSFSKQYKFDITIVFIPILGSNPDDLFNAIYREISTSKILHTRKNKYSCNIEIPILGDVTHDNMGNITIKMVGYAKKICKGYSCF